MLRRSKFDLMRLSVLSLSTALVLCAGSAQAAWKLLDDFEGQAAGSLVNGSSGPGVNWESDAVNNIAAHTVEVDPDDASNQAMVILGTSAGQALRGNFNGGTTIADQATGTLYYRFRTPVGADGTVDSVVGLTDSATLTNFNFKSGLRNQTEDITPPGGRVPVSTNRLDVRDQGAPGGSYQPVSYLQDNTWYSLWMVSQNTSPGGTHEVYLQSDADPNFATQTQMASIANANTSFAYRVDNPSDIINVYFRTGNNDAGTALSNLYYDDIWLNSNTRDLSVPMIPEPTALVLAAMGLGVFMVRRR